MASDREEMYRLAADLLRGIQQGDPAVLLDFGVALRFTKRSKRNWIAREKTWQI